MDRLASNSLVSGLSIFLILLVSGCAGTRAASELEAKDVVGAWVLEGESESAHLVVAPDGTYKAESWPKDFLCSAPGPAKAGDIDFGNLVEFSGTWEIPDEANPYLLLFFIDTEECSNRSWSTDVWENDFGPYEMKIALQSADPDDPSSDQIVRLRKVTD